MSTVSGGWRRGRDIYAITAPIVVGAAERMLPAAGVVTAGEIFDAEGFCAP